ncbi:hypothetical protein J3R30DRAFT_3696301 [Lentinula aciculospora]|uniref:ADF-H domain-containing protein n=1 Tax=Lentinula aciculospora TaxID=153920 RepID=A0A9W9APN7_9AGAR|nr:hypothetical protein J3R30DRAFT_3281224 [Lentinula aciculospora]KAJ4488519.1 hypothetical protein J3R30DRAFT_3696301 [Lentinula aciculospora]
MSATSGIGVSQELSSQFSSAVDSKSIRFLKISIRNESLVHDQSVPVEGSLTEDLAKLQDLLLDDVPAYILAKLDDPSTEWLAIYYVPESAKVRDKMLYASTRASLLKHLGSTVFTDSLFATSKSDLTSEAYLAHLKHIAAPKPLSTREQEMEDIRLAERNSNTPSYEGSRSRTSIVGTGVGLNWTADVEKAVEELGNGSGSGIVVIAIDTTSETLVLSSSPPVTIDTLKSSLPSSEPCYTFFAWPHDHTDPPRREIVFIYSCPSTSPIKHRMLYSSGCTGVFQAAKTLLATSSDSHINARKIETSDPTELDEVYLKSELGFDTIAANGSAGATAKPLPGDTTKSFAKPRGPARKVR